MARVRGVIAAADRVEAAADTGASVAHRHRPAAGHDDGHLVIEVERRLQDRSRRPDRRSASTAFMNARLPPAVTKIRVAIQIETVLGGQLLTRARLDELRQPLDRPVAMRLGIGEKRRDRRERLGRRPVRDHPLPQRDRARRLTDPLADDRDDRRPAPPPFAMTSSDSIQRRLVEAGLQPRRFCLNATIPGRG